MSETGLIVNGARGRMGEAILRCAAAEETLRVVGKVDVGDSIEPLLASADVVIDFSHREVTVDLAEKCHASKTALVIGTTGHSDEQRQALLEISRELPMVWAPNFSVGVNTLFWLTRQAVRILGPDFDLEVTEMHHRLKKDAPSGTARRLAEILAEERGLSYDQNVRHGREGMVGERPDAEIGMHSLRGGDVVGDHTVTFAADGERLELSHRASSRDTFAKGALRAAGWVVKQAPGLYDMEDVLGLHNRG